MGIRVTENTPLRYRIFNHSLVFVEIIVFALIFLFSLTFRLFPRIKFLNERLVNWKALVRHKKKIGTSGCHTYESTNQQKQAGYGVSANSWWSQHWVLCHYNIGKTNYLFVKLICYRCNPINIWSDKIGVDFFPI